MTKITQEYINNLLNKHEIPHLDLSSPDLSGEIEDLNEFSNLKGIDAANNGFTKLDFLSTIPNKEKVEKINLFGNKIGEVDLAKIFTEFSNLNYLNLEKNPVSLKNPKNPENLTSEQLNKLTERMNTKQIKISDNSGLLEYTQKLQKLIQKDA